MSTFNVSTEDYAEGLRLRGGVAVSNFDDVVIIDVANVSLAEGEIFEIINDEKHLYKMTFEGSDRKQPLLLVPTKDGLLKELYLSAITRKFNVCDSNCKPVQGADGKPLQVQSDGTFVAVWKKYQVAGKGLKPLNGMLVKVTKVNDSYQKAIRQNGETVARYVKIFTFDCCDKNGKKLTQEQIDKFIKDNE